MSVKRLKRSLPCVNNHILQENCLLFVVGVYDNAVITCTHSDKIEIPH